MATSKFAVTQRQVDVDTLGALRERIEVLQKVERALTAKLNRRACKTQGLSYTLTVFDSSNRSFNYRKAERLLGEVAFSKCWTTNEFRTSRLTKIKKA